MQNGICDNFNILEDLTEWNAHFFSRCITAFNKISKYSLFAFFLYDMLGVSSLLITIQSELVEYKIPA